MSDIVKTAKKHWRKEELKKKIYQTTEDKLIFVAYDGLWEAGPKLIAFLSGVAHLNDLVVLDANGVPRKVNPDDLLNQTLDRYQQVMNLMYQEWQDIDRD